MGYRSDVTAVFYVSKEDHFSVLKLWLEENLDMVEWGKTCGGSAEA